MWNQLKALINFNAFCRGFEAYHEMLTAMGLAPAVPPTNEPFPTSQSGAIPVNSLSDVAGIYAMKGFRMIPRYVAPVSSTHNNYHLN